jgi:hypothetical protein
VSVPALPSLEIAAPLPVWSAVLLGVPALYFLVSYCYLARWHGKPVLWNTIVHENGRLSLVGSLLYFDHFLGCVPMVAFFALCTAGGFALGARVPELADPARAHVLAAVLLGGGVSLVIVAFVASVRTVGWQQTMDYALQRIERDGVLSRGGTWNQLQLSNVPIALGIVALSSATEMALAPSGGSPQSGLRYAGVLCLLAGVILNVAITVMGGRSCRSFLNPRWLAHSVREIATYPFTGVLIAFFVVLLVEHAISGVDSVTIHLGVISLLLMLTCLAMALGQLLALKDAPVLEMAQRPAFAKHGLSISYLMASHVFEHVLDFALLGALAGGLYAGLRGWSAG